MLALCFEAIERQNERELFDEEVASWLTGIHSLLALALTKLPTSTSRWGLKSNFLRALAQGKRRGRPHTRLCNIVTVCTTNKLVYRRFVVEGRALGIVLGLSVCMEAHLRAPRCVSDAQLQGRERT